MGVANHQYFQMCKNVAQIQLRDFPFCSKSFNFDENKIKENNLYLFRKNVL